VVATKCLKVGNGIIAILENAGIEAYPTVAQEEIQIGFSEDTIVISVKDIRIPLTESLLEHLIKNKGGIYVYAGTIGDYLLPLVVSVDISRDALLEAKGAIGILKQKL
jgi:hypothetical protein